MDDQDLSGRPVKLDRKYYKFDMRLLTSIAISISVLCSSTALAQTKTDAGTVILIHAGRLFDSEAGVMLPARDILIKAGMIESVAASIPAPAGAKVIDLSGYTVLPGLIDCHTHLLYLEQPTDGLSMDPVKAVAYEGLALRALHGAARAKTFLAAGITSVRDLGNSGRFGDVALRTAIGDGSVEGPRMYVSGPGLATVGGQFPGLLPQYQNAVDDEYRIIKNAEDARNAVRENVTFGARLIKIYSNNTPNPTYLSMDEMKAIVEEAHLLHVKVAAHATDDTAVRRAVEAGVDSIEHGYQVSDETLALMKQRGTVLVPTDIDDYTNQLYNKRVGAAADADADAIAQFVASEHERLKRAVKAGVTVAAGSDNYIDLGIPQGVAAKRVLFSYKEAGIQPLEILKWATFNAGKLIGDPRLGAIKPKMFADIIAIEGDPTSDFGAIERVKFVMKGGSVYVGR